MPAPLVPKDGAMALVEHLRDEGFDPSISYRMSADHAFSQPLHRLIGSLDRYPVLPIFVSVFTPPYLSFARSRKFGEAVGCYAARLGKRTLLMGTGGLWHNPAHYFPLMGNATPEVHGYQLDGAEAVGGGGFGQAHRQGRPSESRAGRAHPRAPETWHLRRDGRLEPDRVDRASGCGHRVANLAPFSHFNLVSTAPPVVIFSCNTPIDRDQKDTVRNVRVTGEFVVNLVSRSLLEAMNATSAAAPYGVDEFDLGSIAKAPAERVARPRVARAPAHLECRLMQVVEIAPERPGDTASQMVFGRIVAVHLSAKSLNCRKPTPGQERRHDN